MTAIRIVGTTRATTAHPPLKGALTMAEWQARNHGRPTGWIAWLRGKDRKD